MDCEPHDITSWLTWLDVNGLSDAEASVLATYDPTSDQGLQQIASEWVRPRFEQWDAFNQKRMLDVLAKSRDWTRDQLEPIYADLQFPGLNVDFGRVLIMLRHHFLG